jgi:hypothetical protein
MWPKLSNIDEKVKNKILSYSRPDKASSLHPWLRVFSGAKNGLILESNTDIKVLRAAGESTPVIYGDSQSSGIIGKDWTGNPVESNSTRFLRPSPIVTGFSVKEGQDQISRQATLQLTAYTLEQMELIQEYFLEPGYTLFIEWGWNTGARGLTKTTGKGIEEIAKEISQKTLNWKDLVKTRLNTEGEYDAFLGFIVGGNISSEGDTFNISVELRGEPSLPTYLQSYRNSLRLNEGGDDVFASDKVTQLYSVEDLTDDADGNPRTVGSSIAKRRFRYMFNELPSDKQLNKIAVLENSVTANQFINFDKHVEKRIVDSTTRSAFFGGNKSLTISEVEIQKESLFSKNKYIRMDLAVKILNTLGDITEFDIGDKKISFQIDIDDCIIGGFPNMFSTNPNKLIIPGLIPDFTLYFLKGESVTQNKDGSLNETPPYNPDTDLVPFLGQENLFGDYQEEKKYYGYLKYLFVNFDVFKSVLNKKIINNREAFISILNELSSAVNAFWKFQIVEGEFKRKDDNKSLELSLRALAVSGYTGGSTDFYSYFQYDSNSNNQKLEGDIVLKVIDENFVGQLPSNINDNITIFEHNGIGSVFLNANLDISLPASMVGMIVSSRLGTTVTPDASILKTNDETFFLKKNDLFAKRPETNQSQESNKNTPSGERGLTDIQNDLSQYTLKGSGLKTFNVFRGDVFLGEIVEEESSYRGIRNSSNGQLQLVIKLKNEEKKIVTDRKNEKGNNLQAYLEKIDVVPKTSKNTLFTNQSSVDDKELLKDDWFKERFAIHCFDDSDFFNLIKNYYIRSEKKTGLSTLIPIKYSFTILGNSGIRRGDIFKVKGIPKKYSERGIFQVTEIEQTLDGGKWTTQVGGLFRQIQ